ncbi:putative TMhelix containing protein [Vibrio phage 275E43-1]|nr:putative TMhelix containing protein [Vibrio phage 275E43-1]
MGEENGSYLIRVVNVNSNCCGVLCLGFTGRVCEAYQIDEERTILVLDNGALVWQEDTVPVEEVH